MAQVLCNDGTIEQEIVGESLVANCFSHGGIKEHESTTDTPTEVAPTPDCGKFNLKYDCWTPTQKFIIVGGYVVLLGYLIFKYK